MLILRFLVKRKKKKQTILVIFRFLFLPCKTCNILLMSAFFFFSAKKKKWGSPQAESSERLVAQGTQLSGVAGSIPRLWQCPWARHWTLRCSWWGGGTLHGSRGHQGMKVRVNGWMTQWVNVPKKKRNINAAHFPFIHDEWEAIDDAIDLQPCIYI